MKRYALAPISLGVLLGIGVGLRIHVPSLYRAIVVYPSQMFGSSDTNSTAAQQLKMELSSSSGVNSKSQSNVLEIPNGSSNILELPKASLDFVGVWGGYTHSTVYSVIPGNLLAKGPDRISVTFGRQGGNVFIASELYIGSNQRIIGKAGARMFTTTTLW